jgi:hypothetical protein
VVGGEKGSDKAWEGWPPSWYFSWASVLSLALCSEREDRQSSRAWGEVWRRGVEWRALSGSGFGLRFLSGHGAPEVGWSVDHAIGPGWRCAVMRCCRLGLSKAK